jgi:hypothetical protein
MLTEPTTAALTKQFAPFLQAFAQPFWLRQLFHSAPERVYFNEAFVSLFYSMPRLFGFSNMEG